jgi:hypothetical protein
MSERHPRGNRRPRVGHSLDLGERLTTTSVPSPWLRDAHRVLVSWESGCPRRPVVWLGADRPHQPPAVTFEDVLAGMANHQLAASTLTVDLAAPVPVHEVGERVTRGATAVPCLIVAHGCDNVGGRPASAWEG